MPQPRQLARARRGKRRQTVEKTLYRLDIRDLIFLEAFDQRQQRRKKYLDGFRFSVDHLMVSACDGVEVHHHNGRIQTIAVHWGRTGRGDAWHRRPRLVCPDCRKACEKLYFRAEMGPHFACRVCQNLVYESQMCSRGQRPLLQRLRKETRLDHSRMWRKTRRALEAQLRALPQRRARITERLSHPRVQVPLNWG